MENTAERKPLIYISGKITGIENEASEPTPSVTIEQYNIALAALLFHQTKVDYYIQITRAYLYQIEKR